jgi:class 3 adenylate cyclase
MGACAWPACRKGEGLGIGARMSSKPTEVSRRLVAVFTADVEGYSRLMGTDEVGTVKELTEVVTSPRSAAVTDEWKHQSATG